MQRGVLRGSSNKSYSTGQEETGHCAQIHRRAARSEEATKSGGRVQGRKDAACWLGCSRANITEAGTRGRRAVIAPRERKLRRTYTPRASPARARALRIPGAMSRCRRGTPIWSKDGRLCVCGVCPRASPARARALRIPGLEGTGGVRGEIPRQSENSRLIPVIMVTP